MHCCQARAALAVESRCPVGGARPRGGGGPRAVGAANKRRAVGGRARVRACCHRPSWAGEIGPGLRPRPHPGSAEPGLPAPSFQLGTEGSPSAEYWLSSLIPVSQTGRHLTTTREEKGMWVPLPQYCGLLLLRPCLSLEKWLAVVV